MFVKAIHRSGDFIDIGCANGLLLETLTAWARHEGFDRAEVPGVSIAWTEAPGVAAER